MIKAIIFDSDGMLTHGPRFSDKYASEHNISVDEMLPFFKGPFNNCLIGKADLKTELRNNWLEKWNWNKSVDDLLTYWFSVGDKLDQQIFNTIPKIRQKGIICILATNQEKYRTNYLSKTFRYDQVFDKVFSSACVGFKKPSYDFFDVIFKYLQTKDSTIIKDDIIFWDDKIENIESAKSYGLQAEIFTTTESYISTIKKQDLL